jgi:hypothetical protein
MTAGGWFTMILSVGFVVLLFAWCIWRVLGSRQPPEGHIHGMEDIDKGED